MPYQPVQDGRRAVRATAHRARRAARTLNNNGKLFVVTGPSGAGKGTLIHELLSRRGDLEVAVSATTRPRRPGEVDGREYLFLDEPTFLATVADGEFLEHVVYVSGHRYGTLRREVERVLAGGRSCILELETEGARAIQATARAVTIFVVPPSFAELERRLRERATESAGEIDERLELARHQLAEADDFDYRVVNDSLERAVAELERVVTLELGEVRSGERRKDVSVD